MSRSTSSHRTGVAGWVVHPRESYDQGRLSLERIKRLERLTPDGNRLGRWVTVHRRAHGKGSLTPERARRLERLKAWLWVAKDATN